MAAVGVLVAALGLSACGRKGPLDPPPGAAQYATQPPPAGATPVVPDPQMGVDRDGRAVAPPPSNQNKSFILDWLVD